MKRSGATILVLSVLALLASGPRAFAHALGAECKIRGDRVVVEAYFSDNTSAQDARITVVDDANREVANGKTDAAGRWSFPVPVAGRYEVVVEAGMGHRTTVSFTVDAAATNVSSTTADVPAIVTEAPTRAEFTRLPWERILGGLIAIAWAGAGLRWWLRRKGRSSIPTSGQEFSPRAAERAKNRPI